MHADGKWYDDPCDNAYFTPCKQTEGTNFALSKFILIYSINNDITERNFSWITLICSMKCLHTTRSQRSIPLFTDKTLLNRIVVQPLTTPGPLEGECPDPIGGIEWVEYGSHCYLFDTISTDIG